ncbi:hypothetical protein Dsin_022169 [Dipteronia sinensis]|uniref:Agenet-like domain-containing protein n=1 Tax=Dipteronia sinensis TaxID=43782 RepID=A0AAE0A145_9ROSI|nr:hypothetical protein Dsin_022169 [Dipteronia sinensis]
MIDNPGNESGSGWKLVAYELSYKKLKHGVSGMKLLSHKHIECQPWQGSMYKVDEKIELLCQDSGIRGCWFRCTVVQESRKQTKVRYDGVHDDDGCGNLEEGIPALKVAIPDKLGMRCSGAAQLSDQAMLMIRQTTFLMSELLLMHGGAMAGGRAP